MSQKEEKVNPFVCPLCGGENSCGNLSNKSECKSCWCDDPSIKFTSELLAMVPSEVKSKACICHVCVMNHHKNISVKNT